MLTKSVFERPTPTGKDTFSLLIRLEATTFGTLSVYSFRVDLGEGLGKTTALECSNEKSPLPVDVLRSKTPFLTSLLIHLEEGFFLGRGGGWGAYYQMYCLPIAGPITCGEGLISFVRFGTSFLFCT